MAGPPVIVVPSRRRPGRGPLPIRWARRRKLVQWPCTAERKSQGGRMRGKVLATSAKNLLLTGYGMTLGFSTIVIPSVDASLRENTLNSSYNSSQSSFVDPLQLTREEISWFSSINLICVPLGCLLSDSLSQPLYLYLCSGSINLICVPLGCLLSGSLTQPLGRKRAMMLVNIPFIAAWIMFHYASSVGMLYTSLALTGFGGGLLEAPVTLWSKGKVSDFCARGPGLNPRSRHRFI
uniref:Uncharacterized protein n=1 Tax=Timema genevievae TaxID=629358 RepID=A0A7R9K853_TIMGE|nr:unnamed protein product [Timema genevievae]